MMTSYSYSSCYYSSSYSFRHQAASTAKSQLIVIGGLCYYSLL
jgi:hypothetical protein